MKTIAFVPIKLNSERCHLKNIRKFTNGKPLVFYILNTLLKIKELDGIYVYCSSEEIQDYLPQGVELIKRDKYFDLQTTPFNQLLLSFTKIVNADTYVLAHATAPFISETSIKLGIKAINKDGYDSAFSVLKMNEFLWQSGKPLNYSLDNIPRTQDLEELMIETCGLYVFKKELIEKTHQRIGNNPFFIPVSKIESCDINTEEDFEIADAIFNYKNHFFLNKIKHE